MIDLPLQPTRREGDKYIWDFIYKGDITLHDLTSHKRQLMIAGFRVESFVIKATDHAYGQGCPFSVLHFHIEGISLISRSGGLTVKEVIEDELVGSGE